MILIETYQHHAAVHFHDVVTDCSYALAGFLVSKLFGAFPVQSYIATFHVANVFKRNVKKQ